MTPRQPPAASAPHRRRTAALVLALAASAAAQAAEDKTAPVDASGTPRVLFFSHSAGFVHPVVRRAQRAVLAHAERCFVDAAGPSLRVETSQDCADLAADRLGRYRALVFYTTGELPLAEPDRRALIDWVASGGGFVGVHSASDTFYQLPEYGEMLGGYFDGHPWHREVVLAIEDRSHPTTFHLGESLRITDEIYQFRDWSRDRVHVLLRLTGEGIDLSLGNREDRDNALSWCREYGDGRVFYTALGHRPEVWQDARFLTHLLAGVRWTMARAGIDAPPPGADVLIGSDGASGLQHADGDELRWQYAEDGSVTVAAGSGSAVSRQGYRDLRLHVEFAVPEGDDKERGNSGVYVQRRYEVQILDSAGGPPDARQCGGLYGVRAPDFNATRAAGEWQTFDVWFRAARFDGEGNKIENARITVVHNGILVHRDVELTGPTGQGMAEEPGTQPLLLQDHGSPVRFRNCWCVPL